jgi:type IV pilus assembly protein PilA
MLARIRKTQEEREGGFTLIELLVVIIIIGILAAIAIPTFLNQRQKGYKADMKSALKNAATAAESYATEHGGSYNPTIDGVPAPINDTRLADEGFRASQFVDVEVVSATADEFCLSATDDRVDVTYYYSSDTGAPSEDDCSPPPPAE